MNTIFEIIWIIVSLIFIVYTIFIFIVYITLGFFSKSEIKRYMRKNSYVDYKSILRSPVTPHITVIAPAFNEGRTIVDNVRSLLSLQYPNYEVIVINDGSDDDTIAQLVEHYQLEETPYAYNQQIPTEQVRRIYRSNDESLHKLIVVDKDNGGKADALNVGLNMARNSLVCAVDVDTIMERDALLKVVKPFLEDEKVVASGGVIRIANNCEVVDGRIVKVKLPDKLLPRIQTVEYIRSFLLGRLAFSKLNGLLIISGAFGLFNKDLLLKIGGYNRNTVTEDLEMIVRLRKYLYENKSDNKVEYVPDPLCWTEVPETVSQLYRQRIRWSRGMIETLWYHKDMFFNPRYGRLGTLTYPYLFFMEWLTPLLEITGYILILLFLIGGVLSLKMMLLLLAFVVTFSFMYSVVAILSEELTFNQYKSRKDVWKMILAALAEPFGYHQIIAWCSFQANFDFLFRKRKKWGVMTRKGFGKQRKTAEQTT